MRVLFIFKPLIVIFPWKEVLLLYSTLGFGLVMMVMVTPISSAYTTVSTTLDRVGPIPTVVLTKLSIYLSTTIIVT